MDNQQRAHERSSLMNEGSVNYLSLEEEEMERPKTPLQKKKGQSLTISLGDGDSERFKSQNANKRNEANRTASAFYAYRPKSTV